MDFKTKQINDKKTAAVVTWFLHEPFQNMLNVAGLHRLTKLSSPVLSDMPLAHSNANNQEKKITDGLDEAHYEQRGCLAILETINNLTQTPKAPHKQVLQDVFLKEYTIDRTAMDVGCSSKTINNLKRSACVEFAQRFNLQKAKYDRNDLPELRRWD